MSRQDRAAAYTSSEANRVAREWIRTCENDHSICRKSMFSSGFTLPRRLIDIGGLGSRKCFLVETASLADKSCRYVALSHRWGDPSKLLQTVASNVSEHYEGIDWDALPRTFQDAIIVSQSLAIRYLWIDSLCIIQKDRTDFEQECSSMHLIYLHCYCMIAASDASDSSEGFLQLWDRLCNIGWDALVANMREHEQAPAFSPPTSDFRTNRYLKWPEWTKVLQGTLSTRGWAYQERQLSPRILHFTKLGVMWECRRSFGAGDSSWLQLRRSMFYFDLQSANATIPQTKLFRLLDTRTTFRVNFIERWVFMIEEYSSKQLSYLDDKLPALSGLAAAISFVEEDTYQSGSRMTALYVAGVWAYCLPRQLLWRPITPGSVSLPPKMAPIESNTLPSWAWSSWDGPLTFSHIVRESHQPIKRPALDYGTMKYLHEEDRFMYLATDIVPEGSDPFGRISGSTLNIRGAFWDVHFPTATLLHRTYHECTCILRRGSLAIHIAFDCQDPFLENLVVRLLFLLGDSSWDCGIVMQPSGTGTFRRLGVFGCLGRDREQELTEGDMTLV